MNRKINLLILVTLSLLAISLEQTAQAMELSTDRELSTETPTHALAKEVAKGMYCNTGTMAQLIRAGAKLYEAPTYKPGDEPPQARPGDTVLHLAAKQNILVSQDYCERLLQLQKSINDNTPQAILIEAKQLLLCLYRMKNRDTKEDPEDAEEVKVEKRCSIAASTLYRECRKLLFPYLEMKNCMPLKILLNIKNADGYQPFDLLPIPLLYPYANPNSKTAAVYRTYKRLRAHAPEIRGGTRFLAAIILSLSVDMILNYKTLGKPVFCNSFAIESAIILKHYGFKVPQSMFFMYALLNLHFLLTIFKT